MSDGTISSTYVTSTWLSDVWKFLSEKKLFIQDDLPNLELQRENDRYIMDIALTQGSFSTNELQKINGCRLFLQVTSLADITSGDGTFILKHYWDGARDGSVISPFRWPKQGQPKDKEWTLWRKVLKLVCLRGRILFTPLGNWLDTETKYKRKYFYSPAQDIVYERQFDERFRICRLQATRGTEDG